MRLANTMKPSAYLLKISLLLALLPASASAALIFTIDTFTPDQLTISIPEGSTLDATGNPPMGYSARMLALIDSNEVNNNWVVPPAYGDGSGEIGGIGINGASTGEGIGAGTFLSFDFKDELSDGDTVTSAISITWSGSNIFDPSAVSSLLLTWGGDDGSGYPFGDPQGTTSTSAVPDTGSTAALLGAGVAALAFARRRLG